jgi:hypothetical protein
MLRRGEKTGKGEQEMGSRDGPGRRSPLLIGKAEEGETRVDTGTLAHPSVRQRIEQIMTEEKLDESRRSKE